MTSARDILALEKTVLERSFKLFVRDAWQHIDGDEFIHNWHVDAICDHLQAVYDGRIKRLLINIPPGFAKSLLSDVLYPAWVWTTKPEHKFLSTSYSLDLSQRDSRKMRQLVMSDWYQARWPIKLKHDQNEKTNFENTSGGARAVRAFTSLTGARGNTVIVDDPHSVALAWSDTERENTVQHFKAGVPSRLHSRKRDSIIVIMQRLHEEDVSGFILDNPELGYVHLCIPMEYEGNDQQTILGWRDPRTEEGELLFPEFMDAAKVAEEKASLGPVDYAGQHQQRPTPREAGEINITYFQTLHGEKDGQKLRFERFIKGIDGAPVQGWPRGCNYYMTSDHAITENGDYNVFRMWAYDSNKHLWLVDSFRKKCLFQEALGIEIIDGNLTLSGVGALSMVKKWKPLRYFPEDDNTFKAMEGMLKDAMRQTGTFVQIDKQTPHGKNKIAKVQGYKNLAFQGRVHLPNGPIGDAALDEYQRFPNGKNDDQVDADGMIGRVIDTLQPGWTEAPIEDQRPTDYRGNPFGGGGQKSDSETFFI